MNTSSSLAKKHLERTQHPIYESLDNDKRQARFMRMLHNGKKHIQCELATFPVDDPPEYVALSYCWTKAPPTCQIELNREAFYVRPNLYAYLELMREEEQTWWIFIDALCINQEDLHERNTQVHLMGDIYGNAVETIAWQGAEGNLDDETARRLSRICDGTTNVSELFDSPDECSRRVTRKAFMDAFLNRRYWSRVWIVQELVVARLVILRYQSLVLPLEYLDAYWCAKYKRYSSKFAPGQSFVDQSLSAFDALRTRWGQREEEYTACAVLWLRARLRRTTPCLRSIKIADAIRMFAKQECTMPRIELYLRTLIEGLLQDPEDNLLVLFEDVKEGTAHFCVALTAALGLQTNQAAIALTTQLAMQLCRSPSFDYSLIVYVRHYDDIPETSDRHAYRMWKAKGLCRRISKATNIQLWLSKQAGSAVDGRTYNAWVRMVERMVAEVKGQQAES